MLPITNPSSNTFTHHVSNTTATMVVEDIPTRAVQETSKYPSKPIFARKTSNDITTAQLDFPQELANLPFLNIFDEALPTYKVASWDKSITGEDVKKIAQSIFVNNPQQVQSSKSLFDIINKLNTAGSAKQLYDAFNMLGLHKEAEQLLSSAITQHEITNKNNVIRKPSSKVREQSVTTSENMSQLIFILKNKQLPRPGSDMYEKLTKSLSIESTMGNDWIGLASKYKMSVNDVNNINTEAYCRGVLPAVVLMEYIIDKQSDNEMILFDLYKNLTQVHCNLASDLLRWASYK